MNKPVLQLWFSQSIDPKTVTASTITFMDFTGDTIANRANIEISVDSNRATLTLPQLGPGTYSLNVSGVKNYTDTSTLTGYTMSLNAIIPKPQQENQFDFSAGGFHTVWVVPYDGVKASGNNDFGQLGDSTTISRSLPVTIKNLSSSVLDVSAGGTHNLSLTDQQTVMVWGDNRKGQLGIGSNINSLVPVEVPGLNGIVSISAGYDFSLALKNDGTVYSFGSNQFNQLGDNVSGSRNTPAQIPGLNGIISIAAGGTHALALRFDGSVYSWGSNSRGELGDGGLTSSYKPIKIASLNNVTTIAAGLRHSLALTTDHSVYAWGDDSFGQLGDQKASGYSNVPIKVLGFTNGYRIAAGYNSSFVISDQNATYGFGDNSTNQINISSVERLSTPTLLNFKAGYISAGWGHTVSRGFNGSDSSADTWSWGYNQFGQTGNGLTEHSLNPVRPYLSRDPAFFRLYGADRFKTAVSVSIEGWDYGATTVVLARADNFPDALAVSSIAAHAHMPILLTNTDALPDSTSQKLKNLGITQTIIVGGTGAVGTTVESSLPMPTRFSGSDRYATSIAIANGMGVDPYLVYLATGNNFPDALAGSVLAARTNSPIILVDSSLSVDAGRWLGDHSRDVKEFYVLGGSGVVPDSVLQSVYLQISN